MIQLIIVTGIFLVLFVCVVGYWVERLLKIFYEKKQQSQQCFLANIDGIIKSLYNYLTEDIEHEQNR
jgi:hypothetical protein